MELRWGRVWKLHSCESKDNLVDSDSATKCLLAASAAYIAVEMHGWVLVSLKDGVVAAKSMSGLEEGL